jgi:NAD(P)-dependent dehydrogenase (short-subunit alcohol dehydrogenase family)
MADIRFDDRVAIVTGAGGGLGREHALLLASRGAKVVVNDLGVASDGTGASPRPAERTVKEIEDRGGVAVAEASTVATVEGGQAIVDTALEAFGRVDIVISNAGILRDKAFHNLTPELLDPVLDVHLKGAFHVIRPAWVRMREAGYGRVLVTASNAGILGNFGQANYGAAKMGLVGLARVLAQEGSRYDIKANVLAPIARTRMTEELLGPLAPKLDPGLVAPVAAWLVHEDCPVSGEIYSAGGGRVARFFVGLTEGYANPALTVEDVRDHFGQVRDETGYSVPAGVADELSSLVERLRSGPRGPRTR